MGLLRRLVGPGILLLGLLLTAGCTRSADSVDFAQSVDPEVLVGQIAIWPPGHGGKDAESVALRFGREVLLWDDVQVKAVESETSGSTWLVIAQGQNHLGLLAVAVGNEDWRVQTVDGGDAFPGSVILGSIGAEGTATLGVSPPEGTARAIAHIRDSAGATSAWGADVVELGDNVEFPLPGLRRDEVATVLVIYEDSAGVRISADGAHYSLIAS